MWEKMKQAAKQRECLLFLTPQYPFKQKSCAHPQRRIIQADDTANIEFGTTVVPGTAVVFF